MNKFMTVILILFTALSCKDHVTTLVKNTPESKVPAKISESAKQDLKDGFLFIKISSIYHNGEEILILNHDKLPAITFRNKTVLIDNENFDIINDENLYKEKIKVEFFFPEYGLFILKSAPENEGFYKVQINNKYFFIDSKEYKNLVSFKTEEEYILDSFPNPTKENPLRISPDENSDVIPNFEDYTYISVEIKGDWLKVKDNKDCYSEDAPSEKDIIGWVRWKKDGKIIIDLRHIC